jgi:hypothetical protein
VITILNDAGGVAKGGYLHMTATRVFSRIHVVERQAKWLVERNSC